MNFIHFSYQKFFKVIGIMTGTSLDGVDLSLCSFTKKDFPSMKIEKNFFFPFAPALKDKIFEIIHSKNPIEEISQFNFYYSQFIAEVVNIFLKANQIEKKDIDLISIHGQTLWHHPSPNFYLDKEIASTYQAGNLSALAKILGIPVAGDFRSADIALGGQGAPLVPIFDYYFFKMKTKDIICLNIGGISNITYIKKAAAPENVIGFDTGPGNVLIDLAINKFFQLPFDEDSKIAKTGKVNLKLINYLMNDPFINAGSPKSTGREYYNSDYLNEALAHINPKTKPQDIVRTLTEFTALSIWANINKLSSQSARIIVSGGGRNNPLLMERLKFHLSNCTFINIEDYGIDPNFKESAAFAFLGYLLLTETTGNIPSVTGAKQSTVLGTLAL